VSGGFLRGLWGVVEETHLFSLVAMSLLPISSAK
jgi:hypothetical protein